ncbi:MAG: acetylxylan esterase, partial [Planctomycetia bacterium]|nr:acetylxylan esterase [Planctomycetia bacterium]
GTVGESVKRINTVFPHWFNDRFKQFNDQPDKLPIDQNDLVAMVAPRPVLFTCAADDTWSNPEGQFQVLKAAEPVYKLLGAGDLEATRVPETGKLVDSTLGYAIRTGKHSMTRDDWAFFLDFADTHFGRRGPR